MKDTPRESPDKLTAVHPLVQILWRLPPGRRAAAMRSALSFIPDAALKESFGVGPLRAAIAEYWEQLTGNPVPIRCLRDELEQPLRIGVVLQCGLLNVAADEHELASGFANLLDDLVRRISTDVTSQLRLFEVEKAVTLRSKVTPTHPGVVDKLWKLVESGHKFTTIYADPPWSYENEASRAAAANHYPTMSVKDICAEPVRELAADNAHVHLWTTNAFLRDAFEVIDAWGFQYKSCFVWVKPEIGMGNYWRVSHEFLLLGVRGQLTFRDRTRRSWIEAPRTVHSKKPGCIRAVIEEVSPGPYLEMYGREEFPDSSWTVYGNQVERRLF